MSALKNKFDEKNFFDVIKTENRSFCQYFFEKCKENQILINTFFATETLKPITYNLILLTFIIELYFVINAFFYNDEYLSNVFEAAAASTEIIYNKDEYIGEELKLYFESLLDTNY